MRAAARQLVDGVVEVVVLPASMAADGVVDLYLGEVVRAWSGYPQRDYHRPVGVRARRGDGCGQRVRHVHAGALLGQVPGRTTYGSANLRQYIGGRVPQPEPPAGGD